MGTAKLATIGQIGFDVNQTLTASQAAAFKVADYSFAMRYVRRDSRSQNDLSTDEIAVLHAAGIAVSIVQHFGPAEGWVPTEALGIAYGANAATACHEISIPAGVTVWLDLEGVAPTVDAETVIRYANAWYSTVAAAGFEPGIYVGWGNGLTGEQLYKRLHFRRYMAAFNLNSDMAPIVRGVCVKQRAAQGGDRPSGITFPFDVDAVLGDALGGLPTFLAP